MMSLIDHPTFLRTVLQIDAATCVATGLLMTAGSGLVSGLTQIPGTLLMTAGASLFPIAAFMAFISGRTPVWLLGVWLVILGNAGWVLASVWLLVGGAINPNALGVAFVLFQAGAVAILAGLEYLGLQRLAVSRLSAHADVHTDTPKAR
jgi:hypothetical protein